MRCIKLKDSLAAQELLRAIADDNAIPFTHPSLETGNSVPVGVHPSLHCQVLVGLKCDIVP